MKYLFPLALVGLMLSLFVGCEIETASLISETQKSDDMINSIYLFDLSGDLENFGVIPLDGIDLNELNANSLDDASSKKGNSVTGHFMTQPSLVNGNSARVSLSGVQNNGGVHGQLELKGTSFDIHMDTECLIIDGGEAVYVGQITQLRDTAGLGLVGWAVGNYFYFKVFDNGQGNKSIFSSSNKGVKKPNASPDQYSAVTFNIPGPSFCGAPWMTIDHLVSPAFAAAFGLPSNGMPWDTLGILNVLGPGNIQVK